jgi:uncharacterized membrane protein YccC
MTNLHERTARLREAVVPGRLAEAMPDWLTQAVRPKPAPVPWGAMIRAALAVCVPLSVGIVIGRRDLGLVSAIGGLTGTVLDTGGPYVVRVKQVVTAGVFGGAAGLAIGMFIHHRGWVAVASLVVVAGVSALISRLGSTGSATGLQLLVFASLGLGPFGALRPWWHIALGFAAGVAWALLLLVPGWLLSPRSAALNTAYDTLLTARATAGGRSRHMMHLMAVLNASSRVSDAVITLRREGTRPPALVAGTLDRLADAVLGAVILAAVPYGPWLLFPMAVLAAGRPYGRLRNYGLVTTFQTPLVVLLIDLLAPAGWRLPEERLVDTLLGCAIVLLVGYASWPSSWRSHLPRQFAATLRDICRFMEAPLIPDLDPPPRGRGSQLRRKAYRAVGDLHGEYQRAMSEPAAVSRRASAWWPAIVALDEVADAATATGVAIRRGAPAPSPDAVRQLGAALYAVADAIDAGVPPRAGELPGDEALKPVTDAVRPLLSVLGPGPQPTRPGAAVT